MKTIFHPLLVLLAKLTDAVVARQLKHQARELQFAKAENEQLRGRLPERVILTPQERRRLIRLGKPLGERHQGPHHDRVASHLSALAPGGKNRQAAG